MDSKRIVIYAKDVEIITGRSGRSARKIMAAIRKTLGKEKHQFISVSEFCTYSGLRENDVLSHFSNIF